MLSQAHTPYLVRVAYFGHTYTVQTGTVTAASLNCIGMLRIGYSGRRRLNLHMPSLNNLRNIIISAVATTHKCQSQSVMLGEMK